jgi:putative transcriptional regulator
MDAKLFAELKRSIRQAGQIARGTRKPSRRFEFTPSRIQTVREKAKLSQPEFARLLGVSVRTLQNWEQARREPTGPAKALLRIVELEPAVALRVLTADSAPAAAGSKARRD